MNERLERWKPSARVRTHLLAAAGLWTVVGAGLTVVGSVWSLHGPRWASFAVPVAVGVGLLKSWLVLDRAACRTADRIEARGDGRCLGGFLSIGTWLLVALMMTAGRILRGGLVPRHWVGLVYVAVGTALLGSSRVAWVRWRARAAEGG